MSVDIFKRPEKVKMKSSYKTAFSVGAVALVLAGAAYSDPTASALGQWTVNNGTINAPCAGGFTSCGAAITDNGFMSRQITDSATGKQYFQTIVTSPNATATTPAAVASLDFSDENLVSFGGVNGILDQQRISQTQTLVIPGTGNVALGIPPLTHDVVFNNGSIIGSGWATNFVSLTQEIADPVATGGDGFQTDFVYKQVGIVGANQYPTGKGLKISSYVPIDLVAGDQQGFVLVNEQGNFVTASGSATLPGPTGGTLNWAPGTNNGTASPTPQIQALWVGQNLSTTSGSNFGYTAYDNFSTSNKISVFSLSNSAATNWDTATWGDLNTVGPITAPFPTLP